MTDKMENFPNGTGSTAGTEGFSGIDSDALYRAVVEYIADGIAISVGMERVFVNRAFLAIHGLREPSEAIGKPLDYFIVTEDREETNKRVYARMRGELADGIVEYRILRPDGGVRAVQVSVVATAYQGKPAILSVLRDVTDIKAAEMEIRRLNKELEQHIHDLTSTNHDLETFNSTVSHDLRTPLMAIEAFSKKLEEQCGPMLNDKGLRYLGIVRSSANRMEQLIGDLLAYSRLGRQALQQAPIEMNELFRSLIAELQAAYPGGVVDLSPLPDAVGDQGMIRQAVQNLLSNAFKFTKHKPERVIKIEGTLQQGECVYTVRDNGAGFDVEDTEKLFEIFRRFHGSDEFEGTGVGLAIVKRIVNLHGGRVWAEGRPGEGATFTFPLPRETPAQAVEDD
jgi:PAS domain S-box-containing protein